MLVTVRVCDAFGKAATQTAAPSRQAPHPNPAVGSPETTRAYTAARSKPLPLPKVRSNTRCPVSTFAVVNMQCGMFLPQCAKYSEEQMQTG